MAEVGILKPDDQVELLDGDIIPMAPMSSRHAAAVRKFAEFFQRTLADKAIVSVQCPIRLGGAAKGRQQLCQRPPSAGGRVAADSGGAKLAGVRSRHQDSAVCSRGHSGNMAGQSRIAAVGNLSRARPAGVRPNHRESTRRNSRSEGFPQASVNVDNLLV